MTKYRILMVSGLLPTREKANSQPFIRDQIDSLAQHCDITVYQVAGSKINKFIKAYGHIKKHRSTYDIIHVHYGLFATPVLLAKPEIPVVLSLMGSDLFGTPGRNGKLTPLTRLESILTKALARNCSSVIVKSKHMAEALHPTASTVIPNGVDLSKFRPMDFFECRETLGWEKKGKYVLFPANPARTEKNYPLACESIRLSEKLLKEKVHLVPLNNVQHSEVPILLNAVDLVLMTSFSEGSPNVIKEAMACCRPIVSVEVGDVPELLKDTMHCDCVSFSAAEIAKAITKLLKISPVSSDGRSVIEEKGLSIEKSAGKVFQLYEKLMTLI